jgi:hypothetical protein
MQSGHDHDSRQFHRTKERANNTPPDDDVIEARGGHPHTPQDIEKGPHHPARPSDEPIERETEPARPHRPESDQAPRPSRRNESVE